MSQNKQNSSNKQLESIDKEIRQSLGDGFFAVGTKNAGFVLCFTNQVVSERKFASVDECQDYLNGRPWEVILIATAIYAKMLDEVMTDKK